MLSLRRGLAALAVLGVTAGSGAGALAADPARGAVLYATPPSAGLLACADCHSAEPGLNNFGNIFVGRNAPDLIRRAVSSNTGGMAYFGAFYRDAELADIAAFLGNAPAALTFPASMVGSTTVPQRVTVRASTKVGLEALSLRIDGDADFTIVDSGCAIALDARASCHVDVGFSARAAGPRGARLLIDHGGTPTPVQIALQGTGLPRPTGQATPTPRSLSFGAAGDRRAVTVTNAAQDPVTLLGLTAWPSDFAVDGGSCIAGRVLSPGQSCTAAVGFEPLTTGVRAGELRIAHDGVGGVASVTLSGQVTTLGAPRVAADTIALDFGAQAPGAGGASRMLSVVNNGDRPLRWALVASTEAAFRIVAAGCTVGATLAPGARCQVAVGFWPVRAGAASGELVLAAEGDDTGLRIPLHGHGLGPGDPLVPTLRRLDIREQAGQRSAAHSAHLVNRGSAAVVVREVVVSGADAAEFGVDPDSSCRAGAVVPPGASCVVAMRFAPLGVGSRRATLTVLHPAGVAPVGIELRGTAVSGATPSLWLDAASLEFREQANGLVDDGNLHRVQLRNLGHAPLTLRSLAITGEQAADFVPDSACPVPGDLAPAAACELRIRFAPRGAGQRRASLVIDDGSAAPAVVSLAGRSRAVPMPGLSLSTLDLAFGTRVPGGAPAERLLRLSNPGSSVVRIVDIGVDGPFRLVRPGACVTVLAPGQDCELPIAFEPTADGDHGGLVTVRADDAAAARVVMLSGRGAANLPSLRWIGEPVRRWGNAAAVGQSEPSETVTLTNDGNAAATPAIAVAGAAAIEFSLDPSSSCLGALLQPGRSCSVAVRFHPALAGPRSAWLLAMVGGQEQARIALEAVGLARAGGQPALQPAAVVWQSEPGRPISARRVVIHNAGPGDLSLQAVGVHGTAFAATVPPGGGCALDGFVLLPGDRCELDLLWSGSAAGAAGGTLNLAAADTAEPLALELSVREDPGDRRNAGQGGGAIAPALMLLLVAAAVALRPRRGDRR